MYVLTILISLFRYQKPSKRNIKNRKFHPLYSLRFHFEKQVKTIAKPKPRVLEDELKYLLRVREMRAISRDERARVSTG